MKRFLWITLSLISGLILSVALAAVFVLSPSGSDLILGKSRTLLAQKFQTQMDFSEGRLNLLSGLYFKNLHLIVDRPGLKADILIEELRLAYNFSLFKRALQISELKILRPTIQAEISPVPEVAPVQSSPSAYSLSHPPLYKVDLDDFDLEHLKLNLTKSGGGRLKVSLPDASLKLDWHMVAGEVLSKGDLDLGQGGSLDQDLKTADLERTMHAFFGGQGKWDIRVTEPAGQNLKFESQPSHVDLFADHFTFQQRQNAVTQKISIARVDFGVDSSLTDELTAHLTTQLKQLAVPGTLAHPVDARWTTDLTAPRRADAIQFASAVQVETLRLAEFKGEVKRSAQATTFKGELTASTQPSLAGLLPAVAALKKNPHLTVTMKFDGEADPAWNAQVNAQAEVPSFYVNGQRFPLVVALNEQSHWEAAKQKLDLQGDLVLKHRDFGDWKIKTKLVWTRMIAATMSFLTTGETELRQLSRGAKPLPVEWSGPISVVHNVKQPASGDTEAQVEVRVPEVNVKGMARFTGTKLNLEVRPHEEQGRNLAVEAHLEQTSIVLAPRPGLTLSPLAGLQVDIKGALRDHKILTLAKISAAVDHGLMTINGEAAGNLQSQDFQLHSDFHLNVPAGFPELNGHHVQGEVGMPLTLTVFRGREIAFNTDISFKDFSWKSGDKSVSQINGHIPVGEKLFWKAPHISFVELIDENPFERVDFNRVRPLLTGNEPLRVEHVQWREKSYGPFIGFFTMNQNMVSIHQFDMDIGGGRAYGELFFNVHPANLQMGFLGRLTNLNLTDFLPSDFLVGQDTKSRDLSARAGVVCNLNRSTLEGRLDVTEIGGRQLNALINTLDPTYRDEKMNKIRNMLRIGYPVGVNLAFAEGFMDMDVDLNILSVVTRQSVHSIPLSGFIAKATQGLVQKNQKGVLQ